MRKKFFGCSALACFKLEIAFAIWLKHVYKQKQAKKYHPVARAYDRYKDAIASLANPKARAKTTKKYTQNWAAKQFFVAEAEL